MTNPLKQESGIYPSYFSDQNREIEPSRGKRFNIISYIYLYNKLAIAMSIGAENKILHYPQLDTVLMVEEFIREHSGEYKKRALWEHLPKKMMYQTFQIVYDYLLESGKIARDKEGKICWVWNPELVRKYLQDGSLFVR